MMGTKSILMGAKSKKKKTGVSGNKAAGSGNPKKLGGSVVRPSTKSRSKKYRPGLNSLLRIFSLNSS